MSKATLNVHLMLDASRVAECADHLQAQLEPGPWATLCALAAEIVSRQEAKVGSLVLVVPANRQSEEVVRALGAPGLVRAVDRLRQG